MNELSRGCVLICRSIFHQQIKAMELCEYKIVQDILKMVSVDIAVPLAQIYNGVTW